MAYLTQADLEARMGVPKVLALYDDTNSGSVNTTALGVILQTASDLVDGTIARSYTGTFPMASPQPVLVKEAAMLYAQALSIERKPELISRDDDSFPMKLRKQADTLCERIASGLSRLVDAPPPTAGVNLTGGLVFIDGPRLISTNPDGTSNMGDL
jgi:phage gp36-like protein